MSEWISVEDRLPGDSQTVLAVNSAGVIMLAFIHLPSKTWFRTYAGQQHVTHWMPLPKPPEGESDEANTSP